jgi:hypothetical protein
MRNWFYQIVKRTRSHSGRTAAALVAAVAGVCAIGCAGGDVASGAPGAPDIIYRTIVQLAPDGSSTQTMEAITVAEQQAEIAARAALVETSRSGGGGKAHSQALPTLGVDTGCAAADLWLFDQSNLAGNELCLFKAASDDMAWLDLGTRCRTLRFCLGPGDGTGTWANEVRSLWAGADPGSLQSCTNTLCTSTPFLSFNAYQEFITVTPNGLNWAFLFTP